MATLTHADTCDRVRAYNIAGPGTLLINVACTCEAQWTRLRNGLTVLSNGGYAWTGVNNSIADKKLAEVRTFDPKAYIWQHGPVRYIVLTNVGAYKAF